MILKIGSFVFIFNLIHVHCFPANTGSDAKILSYQNQMRKYGYNFGYETSDQISRHESAVIEPIDEEHAHKSVVGDYSFDFPDGMHYSVVYMAGDKGFRAVVMFGTATRPSGGYSSICDDLTNTILGGGIGSLDRNKAKKKKPCGGKTQKKKP